MLNNLAEAVRIGQEFRERQRGRPGAAGPSQAPAEAPLQPAQPFANLDYTAVTAPATAPTTPLTPNTTPAPIVFEEQDTRTICMDLFQHQQRVCRILRCHCFHATC